MIPEKYMKELRDFFVNQGIEPRVIQWDENIDPDVDFVGAFCLSEEKIVIK